MTNMDSGRVHQFLNKDIFSLKKSNLSSFKTLKTE